MKVDKTKWKKCKLEDLCTKESSNLVISKVEIGKGNYSLFGASGLIGNIDFYQQERPYIGIVKDGSGAGRVAKYPSFTSLVSTMQYILPKENVDIDYLNYLLVSLHLNKYVKGAAIPHIYFRHYKSEQTYLPPLSEQQAIATELDSIQTMIDGYKAQLTDLDALAQSIFLDMFGDPVSNPKGWEKFPLKELVIKMSTGPFGSMLHKDDYDIEGIPAINPQDIKGSSISNENIALVNFNKAKELSKYILHTNDIVIARRGDLSKCAIISQTENGWLCGTGSFFLTLKELNPILFFYFYTSISVQKYLNDKCIGATMPNLNQGILSSLYFPLPPLPLQQQFAERVEAIEKQKELIRQQLTDAEQLMAERMQYYFS